MAGPESIDRRGFLRAGLLSGSIAATGCLSENPAEIPLRFERVINFTESPLQVTVTIQSSEDGTRYRDTKDVQPISAGPSAEWVLSPESVDDAFAYTSEIEIEPNERHTFDHSQLRKRYEGENLEGHCLNVSWFIRDPATDVGPLTEVTTNCGPIEQE